jgi:hypothetical protein
MAIRGKSWPRLLLLAAAGIAGWQLWGFFSSEESGPKQLVNQIWLERMPRDPRDMVYVAALIEREGKRLGVVQRASRWRSHQDVFLWRVDGDRLRTRFPQDGKRFNLQVRTWECEGQAPRPFQLCLEAKRGNQVLRFFSRKDWVIRSAEDGPPPAEVAWLEPSWRGPLDVAHTEELGDGPETEGWGPFGDGR